MFEKLIEYAMKKQIELEKSGEPAITIRYWSGYIAGLQAAQKALDDAMNEMGKEHK